MPTFLQEIPAFELPFRAMTSNCGGALPGVIGKLMCCYGYRLCIGGEYLQGAPPPSVGGSSLAILRRGVIRRGQGGFLTPPYPHPRSCHGNEALFPPTLPPFSLIKKDFF